MELWNKVYYLLVILHILLLIARVSDIKPCSIPLLDFRNKFLIFPEHSIEAS